VAQRLLLLIPVNSNSGFGGNMKKTSPIWYAFMVFSLLLLLTAVRANGDELVPGLKEYAAMERGNTCAIVRRLVARTQREIQATHQQLAREDKQLRNRRAKLDKCCQEKHIGSLDNPDNAALAAELCSSQYSQWLTPGFGRHIGEADLKTSNDTLRLLAGHLDLNCRPPSMPPRKVASKDK
jgi:hypothetical protein